MKMLGSVAVGRDNNFNLLRALLAGAVLVSHAYPITSGAGTAEPLSEQLGLSLGGLAVQAFFVISGFLIPGSFERARTSTEYVIARWLRLWPALAVSVLLVAFALGPCFTSLELAAYFGHPTLCSFVARNLSLVEMQFALPGVFESSPYPAVEGSIWTLPYEALCYAGIWLFGAAGLLTRKRPMACLIILLGLLWLSARTSAVPLGGRAADLLNFGWPFALGVAAHLFRDRIPLSSLLLGALVLVTWALEHPPLRELMRIVTLAYSVFWLAYVPGGLIRHYNRVGDYSYGLYVYAFPVQGLIVAVSGPMTPAENVAIALPLTLVPAVLSWHLVERPSLRQRRRLTDRARRAFGGPAPAAS